MTVFYIINALRGIVVVLEDAVAHNMNNFLL
jgi:hypothetical protein